MKFLVTPATGFVLDITKDADLNTAVTANYLTALIDGISPITDGSFSINKNSNFEVVLNSASKGLEVSGCMNVATLKADYVKGVAAVKPVWTVTVPTVAAGNYGKVVAITFNFSGLPVESRDNHFVATEIITSTSTVASITTSLMKQINTRFNIERYAGVTTPRVSAVDGATLVITAAADFDLVVSNCSGNSASEEVVPCLIVATTPRVIGINTQAQIAETEAFYSPYRGNNPTLGELPNQYQGIRANEFASTTVFDTLRLSWNNKPSDPLGISNQVYLIDFTIAAPTGAAGLAALYNLVVDIISESNIAPVAAGSVATGSVAGPSITGDVNAA